MKWPKVSKIDKIQKYIKQYRVKTFKGIDNVLFCVPCNKSIGFNKPSVKLECTKLFNILDIFYFFILLDDIYYTR